MSEAEFSIDREGVWRHRGEPIRRESLLRLLASLLRRDQRGYAIVAPGQRVAVAVSDAPFLVVDAEYDLSVDPPVLWLLTSVGTRCAVNGEQPLFLRRDPERGEQRLYHAQGDGLCALVHRKVFYRLAELVVSGPDGGGSGIRSAGCFFALE